MLLDEYLPLEQRDAVEVIAWLAEQPWCDGAVGMMGKSWGAYNSLQVAALRPPALKAIVPVMGTDDRWRECIQYAGGALLGAKFWWASVMQGFQSLPPDPAVVGDAWRAMWLERLREQRFWSTEWLEHQTDDAYWRHGSVADDLGAIEAATYFIGGWADLYRDAPFRLAERLRAPFKLLMGPWAHLYPHQGMPGPRVDFVAEALRWWTAGSRGSRTASRTSRRCGSGCRTPLGPTPRGRSRRDAGSRSRAGPRRT